MHFLIVAQDMGVNATQATTAEEFNLQLEKAVSTKGAHLIKAVFWSHNHTNNLSPLYLK